MRRKRERALRQCIVAKRKIERDRAVLAVHAAHDWSELSQAYWLYADQALAQVKAILAKERERAGNLEQRQVILMGCIEEMRAYTPNLKARDVAWQN